MTRPALRIGSLELGARPCVAVPFADSSAASAEQVGALTQRGLDVAELRFDLFGTADAKLWLAALAPFAGVPKLATIRIEAESGGWKGSEAERLTRFRALIPRVDAVDVEIASEIAPDVVAMSRESDKLAIASFHDFAHTPDRAALDATLARGRALGADVVKIAAAVREPCDLRRLARVLVEHDEIGLVVIGMGEAGVASRVLFPLLGSLLTYASVETQTAPGQLDLDELVKLLRRFGD